MKSEHNSHQRHEHEHPEHGMSHGGAHREAAGAAGHDHSGHHRGMIRDFRRRFYISLALTLPILALSEFVYMIWGFSPQVPGAPYYVFAFSTIVFFYGGYPFLKGLAGELRKKAPGMMTLIALAITVSYVYSVAVVLGLLSGHTFFWELATLIDIMLAGHWIEMSSVLGASNALEKLARLMPDTAHRKKDGSAEDVPLAEIRKGDILVIKPGEKVPSDGVVVGGSSYLNESMLTGESKPVEKGAGSRVIGGSINGDGSLDIRVEGTGSESYLSKVIDMVRRAQETKSKTQTLSDRAAFWLTIIALTVGMATLAGWLAAGQELQFAITRMATVMVITCPHALGLAVPLVAAVSTAESARNGLLIRNRTAFENARKITTVLFDKTGTLTHGTFEVSGVLSHSGGWDENRILAAAAALESRSEHPIARGILEKAKQAKLAFSDAEDFSAIKGKGVEGVVDGESMAVASPGRLAELGIAVPEGAAGRAGVTRVFLLAKDRVVGSIGLSDTVRPESRGAVEALRKRGIKCWMVTGDNRETARAVAGELGMDGFFAEVLPDQKQAKVKELQDKGEFVAMTGDGVNDAPALAGADIGIAVGSGTDVAAETADIILVNSNPRDITSLILFGRATYRKMIQNLAWATGYNLFAIPLAAGVLYGYGILLSPAMGAVLMSLSTVIVAINARLLRLERA